MWLGSKEGVRLVSGHLSLVLSSELALFSGPPGCLQQLQALLSLWLTVFLERKFLFPNSLDRHYGIDSSSLNRTMCPHRKQSV